MSEEEQKSATPEGFEKELIELFHAQVRRLKNIGVTSVNGVGLIVAGLEPTSMNLHAVSGTVLPASDTEDQAMLDKYRKLIYDVMLNSFQRGPSGEP